MKKKIYSSYEEIDKELEILKLESELHRHKVVKSVEDLKNNLTFLNLAQGALGLGNIAVKPITKTIFRSALPFIIQKAYSLFRK